MTPAGVISMTAVVPLMQPDRESWPGDALSEKQVLSAIEQFKNDQPWHWVLIGPGDWLLAGTSYRVIPAHLHAPFPNIGLTKGYWGGEPVFGKSVSCVKIMAWTRAETDAEGGITP